MWIFICVPKTSWSLSGLERHEGKKVMTDFSFLGEPTFICRSPGRWLCQNTRTSRCTSTCQDRLCQASWLKTYLLTDIVSFSVLSILLSSVFLFLHNFNKEVGHGNCLFKNKIKCWLLKDGNGTVRGESMHVLRINREQRESLLVLVTHVKVLLQKV